MYLTLVVTMTFWPVDYICWFTTRMSFYFMCNVIFTRTLVKIANSQVSEANTVSTWEVDRLTGV